MAKGEMRDVNFEYRMRWGRGFWMIHVPEFDMFTQANNEQEAAYEVKSMLANYLKVAPQSFTVSLVS